MTRFADGDARRGTAPALADRLGDTTSWSPCHLVTLSSAEVSLRTGGGWGRSRSCRQAPRGPPALLASQEKKPTWWNTRRYSTTSAYSSTSPPTQPGCPSSSRPTTSIPIVLRAGPMVFASFSRPSAMVPTIGIPASISPMDGLYRRRLRWEIAGR